MQLKWLLVRLRRRRVGPDRPSDNSALLRGAGQRQSSPAQEGAGAGGSALARRTYSPASGRSGGD